MNFKLAISSFALVGAITLTNAVAEGPKSPDSTKGEAAFSSSEIKATVKDIDYKTRKVTLKTMDGEEFSFVAGDNVKNLEQVKKGDTIIADYTEAMVYEISKGGKATAPTVKMGSKSARPGAAPEGVIARQVTASVIISEIDKKKPSVTFKNADGETQTFKVRHPERLQGVKVGDKVDLTYVEALALKVEKASPSKTE